MDLLPVFSSYGNFLRKAVSIKFSQVFLSLFLFILKYNFNQKNGVSCYFDTTEASAVSWVCYGYEHEQQNMWAVITQEPVLCPAVGLFRSWLELALPNTGATLGLSSQSSSLQPLLYQSLATQTQHEVSDSVDNILTVNKTQGEPGGFRRVILALQTFKRQPSQFRLQKKSESVFFKEL